MKLHKIKDETKPVEEQVLIERTGMSISDETQTDIEHHLLMMGLKKGTKQYKTMYNSMLSTYECNPSLFDKMLSMD